MIARSRMSKPVLKCGAGVRVQLPLVVSDESEPEPDLCVVEGSHRDYRHEHPRTALLVVEVADSTLAYDRLEAGLYASASVPEYWILNVTDGWLEVFRGGSSGARRALRSFLRVVRGAASGRCGCALRHSVGLHRHRRPAGLSGRPPRLARRATPG